MSLLNQRLTDIQTGLKKREFRVSELVAESNRRIDEIDNKLGAFLTRNQEVAAEQAQKLDEQLTNGEELSPLFGLPIGIKDNIVTKGLRTTCASRMLESYIPVHNATVVEKLRQADTVLMGKLNMDEFAMGSSNETSAFQVTRNPWNLDYVPGGSSGASAAAVAAGEVYFALGSDTGGSIRQPAAYCGVVGIKPSYGLVSRYGLVSYASSFDTIGPITRNVEDAAYVLQALAGHDPFDSTSAKGETTNYIAALTGEIKGMKIGLPKEYMGAGVDPEVKEKVLAALKVLEGMGAIIEEVTLPHTDYATSTYYILASSEASSNLARFDGVRYGYRAPESKDLLDLYMESRSQGFGKEVKQRIMIGTYALSSGYYDAYYVKAQKVRTLIRQDFEKLFANYDLIIGPTSPTTAFKIGDRVTDPLTNYFNDILTISANLAGLPAISVPAGFATNGLPVGLQMIGKAFAEATLFRVAYAYEQQTEHHKARVQL